MSEDYYAPKNVAIHDFGLSHPDLKDNVQETINWIRVEGVSFFPYWEIKKHGNKQ